MFTQTSELTYSSYTINQHCMIKIQAYLNLLLSELVLDAKADHRDTLLTQTELRENIHKECIMLLSYHKSISVVAGAID